MARDLMKLAKIIHESIGKTSLVLKYKDRLGKESERTVTPIAVLCNRGKVGVYAWCAARQAPRTFYLLNVAGVDPVPLEKELATNEVALMVATSDVWLRNALRKGASVMEEERVRAMSEL